MPKGASFERKIAKQLSRWWSGGNRDDIFWRSTQSGGRATQRAKSGRATFGSYGDLAAVDPIGQPLLQCFTIELKRGRSHGSPADSLDMPKHNKKRPFEEALEQAYTAHEQAKSLSWMLICQRDRRDAMVYLDAKVYRVLDLADWDAKLRLQLPKRRLCLVALRLDSFLASVTPKELRIRLLGK